ncbi:MAG: PspA/IM30 family protein [Candidatus Hinthialibacter sp.]
MRTAGTFLVLIAVIVGGYAIWNYAEVRQTMEQLNQEWRVRNWDQRIKDKINDLKDRMEKQEEAVITLKVKNRDVMRKLEKEESAFQKYDEVIRGLVAKMNESKNDPAGAQFVYCGKTYTVESAQAEFERWTSEILPIKKRIDFLQKQKELYDKSIQRINESVAQMQSGIQTLQQRAMELATIRDTLKVQEMAKELVLDVEGFDDSGVKQLFQEMQTYIDEIEIRLEASDELPASSSLDEAVQYQENQEKDTELERLRSQYINAPQPQN